MSSDLSARPSGPPNTRLPLDGAMPVGDAVPFDAIVSGAAATEDFQPDLQPTQVVYADPQALPRTQAATTRIAQAESATSDAFDHLVGTQPAPQQTRRAARELRSPQRNANKVVWALGSVAALAALYTGAQAALASRVPPNTEVLGIQIGGLRHDAAVAHLAAEVAPLEALPITLTAGGSSTTLTAQQAGLAVDSAATVDHLTGFSMSPVRLWEQIFGHREVKPEVTVAADAVNQASELASDRLHIDPVDGTVAIIDGDAVATAARDGQEVAAQTIAADLPQRWLVDSTPAITFEPGAIEPDINQAETDAALAQARELLSGPITVNVSGEAVELSGTDVGETATFRPVNGVLEPHLDGEMLAEKIVAGTTGVFTTPRDAHFVFQGGRPVIIEGTYGTTVDPDAAASAVLTAALGGGTRTATVQLTDKAPEHSVADLEALGVNEVVASFATNITNDAVRTGNLIRGAQLVTGQLIMPGEVFSLTDALSPISPANGFADAGVIIQGVHTEGMGGGLSQMATTAFNAGYFAGFEDIEHRPHSVFITRYPAGREATLSVGSLDMRFRNNTPYAALMQSWVGGGQLHVAIWSTPYFRVETSASARTNVRPAETVHQSGPNCSPQRAGQAGFTITNTRRVYRRDTGALVPEVSGPFTWTYRPDNGISCDPPPNLNPDPDPWFPEQPGAPGETDPGWSW